MHSIKTGGQRRRGAAKEAAAKAKPKAKQKAMRASATLSRAPDRDELPPYEAPPAPWRNDENEQQAAEGLGILHDHEIVSTFLVHMDHQTP